MRQKLKNHAILEQTLVANTGGQTIHLPNVANSTIIKIRYQQNVTIKGSFIIKNHPAINYKELIWTYTSIELKNEEIYR